VPRHAAPCTCGKPTSPVTLHRRRPRSGHQAAPLRAGGAAAAVSESVTAGRGGSPCISLRQAHIPTGRTRQMMPTPVCIEGDTRSPRCILPSRLWGWGGSAQAMVYSACDHGVFLARRAPSRPSVAAPRAAAAAGPVGQGPGAGRALSHGAGGVLLALAAAARRAGGGADEGVEGVVVAAVVTRRRRSIFVEGIIVPEERGTAGHREWSSPLSSHGKRRRWAAPYMCGWMFCAMRTGADLY
jgi:hypothetical protein